METRLLIADDHPAFREGLCLLLQSEADMVVVAKAADGEEAVKLAQQSKPDVAILDVSMPGTDGIQTAKILKSVCPDTTILMLSAFDYESFVLACLRAGASGYLLKNAPTNELISAIRLVRTGKAVFDLKATNGMFRRVGPDEKGYRKDDCELHGRELEVLRLVAKGVTNKAVSTKLGISERTVQSHLANAFGRLGVGSRTEAVTRALKLGWLTTDDLV